MMIFIKVLFVSGFFMLLSPIILAANCADKVVGCKFFSDPPLVPEEIVNNFLSSYTAIEKEAIARDYRNIRELCLAQARKNQQRLIYVATAGGPGGGKSTILEAYLRDHPGFVYIDPDQRALKLMINTYVQELNNYVLSSDPDYSSILTAAYTKWRGASNYIADSLLNAVYGEGLAIAHGTTSTNKNMPILYQKLKGRGYKIILLLCGSTDENRQRAVENRKVKQGVVQSTNEDVKNKGKMFFENLPIYFKFADEIKLFWVDDFSLGWVMVGEYSKDSGFKKTDQSFDKFKNAYEEFRKENVSKNLPSFNDLLVMNS